MLKKLILLFIAIISTGLITAHGSEEEVPKDLVYKNLNLFEYKGERYLALSFRNHPKWHTYWKNPGDAGQPFKFKFTLDGLPIELVQKEWPTPKRYIENGGLLAFGYENSYSFFFKWPHELNGKALTIKTTWLVCKHICIPGRKEIQVEFLDDHFNHKSLKVIKSDENFKVSKEMLIHRFESLPILSSFPQELDLILAKTKGKENSLTLYYNVSEESGYKVVNDENILTPFKVEPFTIKKEQVYQDKKGNLYAKIELEWDGEFLEPPVLLPVNGTFSNPKTFRFIIKNPQTKKYNVIEKTFTGFDLNASEKLESFFELVTPVKNESPKAMPLSGPPATNKSLFYYLLFAFLGGLILNIMPCVLPVISLKLFGLIATSNEDDKSIFKHNMSYTAGVLFTFVLLALIIIVLKNAGEQIGWGFQLQSPTFVAIMTIIIFVMSFNLFELFEFSTPGGRKLGSVSLNHGFKGDFLGGVFATILSTPCSAPFLGTALTFAFTSSPFLIVIMFLAIGVGLAFPFILTAFIPALINFLPKPGMWMNHVKKFLGLTLLLTGVWLLDVFSSQVGQTVAVIKLHTAIVLIFFTIYFKKKISPRKIFVFPLIFACFFLTYSMINSIMSVKLDNTGNSSLLKDKQSKGLLWEKWTPQKLVEYQKNGELVFVDFTAKWCFTCKVNERLVLETDQFKELVLNKNLKLLLADWTKRDEVITKWLQSKGLYGVPAYFVVNSKGELISLGETITISKIKKSLE